MSVNAQFLYKPGIGEITDMTTTRFALALPLAVLLAGCGAGTEDAPEGQDGSTATGAAAQEETVEVVAPAGEYALDKNHAALTWSIPHMGLSDYQARFADYDASLTFDPENPENSAIELSIVPASVTTVFNGEFAEPGYDSWEDRIATDPGMLGAEDGAPITFRSTSVTMTGDRTADVTGDLTMRGQTKPVTMKATFTGNTDAHPMLRVPAIGLSAEGSFKPSEFGVNLMGGALGDEVTVRFNGEFLREEGEAASAEAAE